ncbi:25477_t:CDS:2, partial [Gigaspora margarita]
PNTTNDIESACEIWKKKVKKLKKMTRKSESEIRINPRDIKEPTDPERHEITDVEVNPNDKKTPEKDYERPTELNSKKKEEKSADQTSMNYRTPKCRYLSLKSQIESYIL